MQIVKNRFDEILSILVSACDLKAGTEWIGDQFQPLQASRMIYSAGKEFKTHRHILNPRTIPRTQEAFVVITGKLSVTILDEDKTFLATLEAGPGEMILIYKGYHHVKVLEDCMVYEIKAGQFTSVSDDKEFLDVL